MWNDGDSGGTPSQNLPGALNPLVRMVLGKTRLKEQTPKALDSSPV